MDEKFNEVMDEIRSIKDSLAAEQAKLAEERRSFEQERAAHDAKNPANDKDTVVTSWRDVASAMKEKRAITVNGSGRINVVAELVKEAQKKMPLINEARYFYGRDAQTNIPVWSPTLATPSNYAEGATSISNDSTAALGATSITPYAYVSVLPVSAEALLVSAANLEAELPGIFADSFAHAMFEGMVNGNGSSRNMTGLFAGVAAGNLIEDAASGLPAMGDLVALALKLQDYHDDAFILMNPAVYAAIVASSDGYNQAYKESLIRDKRIEGVRVVLSSACPTTTTGGSVIAVGGKMSDYAIAVAGELSVEPIKVKGDTNTYFQASMFFNGKPIVAKNFYGLKTKA